jgi:hypothetical protein
VGQRLRGLINRDTGSTILLSYVSNVLEKLGHELRDADFVEEVVWRETQEELNAMPLY